MSTPLALKQVVTITDDGSGTPVDYSVALAAGSKYVIEIKSGQEVNGGIWGPFKKIDDEAPTKGLGDLKIGPATSKWACHQFKLGGLYLLELTPSPGDTITFQIRHWTLLDYGNFNVLHKGQ